MKIEKKRNLDSFRNFLKENERNYTVEREGLLNIIRTLHGPHTLPQLYKKAQRRNVVHAKSTLYRNIFLFVEAGLLKEKRFPNGRVIYIPTAR